MLMRCPRTSPTRLSRRLPLLAALFAMLLQGALFHAAPAEARDVPTCEGQTLLPQLRKTDPEAFQALMEAAKKEINSDGVFWKLSKAGGPPSYLLGTVHSTDPRITSLPGSARDALASSKHVAVEIAKLEPVAVQNIMKTQPGLFFNLEGEKLNALLSPEDFKILVEQAKKSGFHAALVPALKPWFASVSFFAIPNCEKLRMGAAKDVLDKLVVDWGKQAGAEIVSLETLEEQYKAFASIPLNDQITMLENGIHTRQMLADMYATTLEAYLNRDLGVIMPLSLAYGRDRLKTIAANASFRNVLIDRRNQLMLERSLPLVEKGQTFIAVGALHLTGQKGLVQLYRDAGYSVEKLY